MSIGKNISTNIFSLCLGLSVLLISALLLSSLSLAAPPPGSTTAPYTVSYSGKLTDNLGVAITTAQEMRFSLWSDNDYDAGDLQVNGSINTGASGYASWQEEHTVTPDSNGLFNLQLGSSTTFPNFTSATHIYLQVEVKAAAAADTSYEVLDPDGDTSDTDDRHTLNSTAFAINADTVDNADVGSSAGNIPVLDGSALLPVATIPGATNADTFILDNNNTISGAGSVTLQFGNTLNKILEFNNTAGYFNFNDDVNITGLLTTTGTINGVTISSSTVGNYNQSLVYEPIYKDGVINKDGSSNLGTLESLYLDVDGAGANNNVNYYKWSTLQTGLQDIDVVLRVTLPEGFSSWQSPPVQLTYKTEDTNTANNKVDIAIEDTSGTSVTLVGASSLAASSFTTAGITFSGSPTWTAGQAITVKIKLSALNTGAAYAGKLKLNYVGR